jgi:hypothetical protein
MPEAAPNLRDPHVADGEVDAGVGGVDVPVPPFTTWTLRWLTVAGPYLGIRRPFRMTADLTDLLCLALIPLAVRYGHARLRQLSRA